MTISADPRSFLYGLGLDPDAAIRLTAQALARADDGELYLQYRKSASFGFDDGRLKTASYDTPSGFGLGSEGRRVGKECVRTGKLGGQSEPYIKKSRDQKLCR